MPDHDRPAPIRTEGERRTRKFVAAFVIFSLAFAGLVGFSKWREINQMAAISKANKADSENAAPVSDDTPQNSK